MVTTLFDLLTSPIGPSLVLVGGVLVLWLAARRNASTALLINLTFAFWFVALGLVINLRLEDVVPIYSQPWQPLLLSGANLLWVGDSWNWYVSVLILLLGGVALLLGSDVRTLPSGRRTPRRLGGVLASHLMLMALALLFVGSGNLLTATLTWVALDIFLLARNAVTPPLLTEQEDERRSRGRSISLNQAQGFSLLGALLLLIALLPAGPLGPGQPLQGGSLPAETITLMFIAAGVRAGAYPFHLWLLPSSSVRLPLVDRFLIQLIPGLCGLWLLGWTSGLAAHGVLDHFSFVVAALFAFLGSTVAAYTVTNKSGHTSFVLISAVGIAGLTSILAESKGPAGVIWPTTTFALAGGLWLVGERIWSEWGWQIPVSVGALALVGAPFTPGFFTHSAIARLLSGEFTGLLVLPIFVIYLVAYTVYVAAMLRSWGVQHHNPNSVRLTNSWRLIVAAVLLAAPLAVAGIFPRFVAAIAALPQAIPHNVGDPPSAVATADVWLTLGWPLLIGMGLALFRPRLWPLLRGWPDRLARFAKLDWFTRLTDWGLNQTAAIWNMGLNLFEGAGAIGWLLAFAILGYYLIG